MTRTVLLNATLVFGIGLCTPALAEESPGPPVCGPSGCYGGGSVGNVSTVTTNSYDSNSTSEDIAVSCRDLKIGSSNGEVDATCNVLVDNAISGKDSKLDLDKVMYCAMTSTGPELTWGTDTYDGSIGSWSLGVSSTGSDYIVSGNCHMTGASTAPTSSLDLGDTTSGTKNQLGSLVKR